MKRIDLKAIVYTLAVFGLSAAIGMGVVNFIAFNADVDFCDSVAPGSPFDFSMNMLQAAKASKTMDTLIADLRRLSRGLINAGQAHEIATVLRSCDKPITSDLVLRIIKRESHFDPRVVGKQGERGLMQVKPVIARLHGFRSDEMFDPIKNVLVGVAELKRLYAKFGSAGLAIAAYAGGENAQNVRYALAIMGE